MSQSAVSKAAQRGRAITEELRLSFLKLYNGINHYKPFPNPVFGWTLFNVAIKFVIAN